MAGTHGEYNELSHELWLRCPFCGDSEHDPDKAHFSINLINGLAFCYKCSTGKKISWAKLFKLANQYDINLEDLNSFVTDTDFDEAIELPELSKGQASQRGSKLKRGHIRLENDLLWDGFEMREPDGEVIGLHLRRPRRMMSIGQIAFGYVGSHLPGSSLNHPLRIVEGPYDVMEDYDVCLFGFYSSTTLKKIKGHFITLCPDGDVWNKSELFRRFIKAIKQVDSFTYVCGVEVIPDGLDPDECPRESRTFVSRKELPSFIKEVKKTHGYKYTTHSSHRGSSRFRKIKDIEALGQL